MNEQDYLKGNKAAWLNMLHYCLKELGFDEEIENPEIKIAKMAKERLEMIAMLRQVCARFGDNHWEDDLYLVDIIDKHLWRKLLDEEEIKKSPRPTF